MVLAGAEPVSADPADLVGRVEELVAAGMDNTIAVPSVFLYRLATYWIPVLPGWLSFGYLQRHHVI